ncbi:amidase family protein [Vibrio gallicus]|uniref:amidase family protein n=1 Tax=Vibrio gallicus TaxID=190897 RepID=UPI0021C4965B|nr:amidase family protein [Vibrio gallicus]
MNQKIITGIVFSSLLISGCNTKDNPIDETKNEPKTSEVSSDISTPQSLTTIANLVGTTCNNDQYSPHLHPTEEGVLVQEPSNYCGKLYRNFAQFKDQLADYDDSQYQLDKPLIIGKSIPQLQELMNNKQLSSVELVKFYLYRAGKYDVDGLNSIIEFNPDIISDAIASDKLRAEQGQGDLSLLGIPVGLKDNIATHDKMHTATGAAAMLAWHPSRDAFLVQRLREKGAIVLGKLNQGEWANFTDTRAANGFSNNGGQTHNPYGLFTTMGSSAGSAVATSADLVGFAIGSETSGSVIAPSEVNGVIGLKTTRGLISRDYVIPLDAAQDSMGIMTHTINDLATTLDVMAKIDPTDTYADENQAAIGRDYFDALSETYRHEVIVGVESRMGLNNNTQFDPTSDQQALYQQLKAGGVQVKYVSYLSNNLSDDYGTWSRIKEPYNFATVLTCGFRDSVNDFLTSLGSDAPFPDLDAIIAYNNENPTARIAYGQDWLIKSVHSPLSRNECQKGHQYRQATARKNMLNFYHKNNIDVLATSYGSYDGVYAPAGYPALTIPYGEYNSRPISIKFIGLHLAEPQLLAAAKSLEVGINHDSNYILDKPDLEHAMTLFKPDSK